MIVENVPDDAQAWIVRQIEAAKTANEPNIWAGVADGRVAVGTVDSYLVARMSRGVHHVTDPTNAVIGEGGSNEYVIPENKMGSAMAKWNAGARGDSVVDGANGAGQGGAAMATEDPAPQITINGGVMQFGGDEFIRKDQLPSIIGQASKQGEARTMRRLQMNPGARRKIGL